MVLLKVVLHIILSHIVLNLHSTMVLLKDKTVITSVYEALNLHSTMVLLKANRHRQKFNKRTKFTFHYGSIKSSTPLQYSYCL
mgnify:CR=1 FL=1